jgi:hypothetical protein
VERFRWWVVGLRDAIEGSSDAKFIGILALVVLLAGGGYIAADKVSQAGAQTGSANAPVRLVTTVRKRVKMRIHGHTVVRWRVRRQVVEAQAQTVMQRQTIRTPTGTRVVTRPVVVYRKKVVKVNGKKSTVVVPQTVTDSRTTTVSRTQTEVQTVTRPTTVVETQTLVSTVTLPATTVTVTLPGGG